MDISWYPLIINIIFFLSLFLGIFLTTVGLSGNLLILISSLIYAFYTDFTILNYNSVIIIIALYVIGEILEFTAGMIGAKKEKASTITILATFIGGILGGIIGSFIFIILGSIIGVLVGSYVFGLISEFIQTNDLGKSLRVARGIIVGQFFGTIFKIIIAISITILIISKF
ncbi:DUF456 domain-containing protein [Selenomonadales bacterium OttesenSCG-928-I06]|nr:DUF456 domain-containing protein [Selenomonadales bacterium OttesenSCG-928-I06]